METNNQMNVEEEKVEKQEIQNLNPPNKEQINTDITQEETNKLEFSKKQRLAFKKSNQKSEDENFKNLDYYN